MLRDIKTLIFLCRTHPQGRNNIDKFQQGKRTRKRIGSRRRDRNGLNKQLVRIAVEQSVRAARIDRGCGK